MKFRKYTNESFIVAAKLIHGDLYKYDRSEVQGVFDPVWIGCNRCGDYFEQTPRRHIDMGRGCRWCNNKESIQSRKWTLEKLIEEGNRIHNGIYRYLSIGDGARDYAIIVCSSHGEFKQTITNHINHQQGCPDCAKENNRRFSTAEKYIKYANELHNNHFDYDLTGFDGTIGFIIKITCKITKKSNNITAHSHIHHLENQKFKCKFCYIEKLKYTKDQWIEIYNNIWGSDKFDYSQLNTDDELAKIKCVEHNNDFKQSFYQHKRRSGCKICIPPNASLPENNLYEFLVKNSSVDNIIRWIEVNNWSIDLFIKNKNTYIQLDGEYWHGLTKSLEELEKSGSKLYTTYLRDREQEEFFKQNNLNLIRITDREFNDYDKNGIICDNMQKILNLFL